MTVTQEVTVCTECAEVTPILVNPFVPPMCEHCGKDIERYGLYYSYGGASAPLFFVRYST